MSTAMECLGYFQGWISDDSIEVYALNEGVYDNIIYHVVDSFDGIETENIKGLKCTSINQTVNDMLSNIQDIDRQPLVEGLSAYFFENGESVERLRILPENKLIFEEILAEAKEYYND